MPKYRNIGGQYVNVAGETIQHGKIFEENELDLCKMFVNHFERVVVEAAKPVKVTEVSDAGDSDSETNDSEPPADERKDVTAGFPDAEKAGLTVIKDKQGWWVYDDDPQEAINTAALRKRDVSDVVEEYLAE